MVGLWTTKTTKILPHGKHPLYGSYAPAFHQIQNITSAPYCEESLASWGVASVSGAGLRLGSGAEPRLHTRAKFRVRLRSSLQLRVSLQ